MRPSSIGRVEKFTRPAVHRDVTLVQSFIQVTDEAQLAYRFARARANIWQGKERIWQVGGQGVHLGTERRTRLLINFVVTLFSGRCIDVQ